MPILGIYASAQQNAFSTAFDSIATVTVGAGGSASISFTSIPSTYKHLQIRGLARSLTGSTGQDDVTIQFNSDATNNYYWHRFGGNGSSTISGNAGGLTSANQLQEFIPRDGQTANYYGGAIIDILDYTNTNKLKVVRGMGAADASGSGSTMLNSFFWNSTSAITSITLTTGSNWKQYTTFALYGIKG